MTRTIPLVAALLAASACQVQKAPGNADATANASADEAAAAAPALPANEAEPAIPASPPATAAPAPTPDDQKSAQAAVATLQAYCDAIAHKNYGSARRKWASNGEASGLSDRQFADSFAKYDAFDCSFGAPGGIEGAAGSAYVTIPTVVTGTLAKGGGFVMRGPITLKRVNDVPGSTVEQRRWHISESGLKPRP